MRQFLYPFHQQGTAPLITSSVYKQLMDLLKEGTGFCLIKQVKFMVCELDFSSVCPSAHVPMARDKEQVYLLWRSENKWDSH